LTVEPSFGEEIMKLPMFTASILAVAVSSGAVMAQESTESSAEEIQQKFQNALNLRAGGDLYSAIEALNSVLIAQPKLHRARLELAVTYYRAAQFTKAVDLANEVMADPETPANVKETVQLFLDQVEAIKVAENDRRHSFSGGFGIGGGHDDNVNAGPSSEIFDINGAELSLAPGSSPQTDAFMTFSGNINHSYRMPGSVDLGARPVMAFWQSNASIYRREYQDEHKFTVDVISASTGLALISRTNWRAKVNLQMDHIRLEDDSLAVYTSLNPSWTYNDGSGNEYTVRGQWLYRDYKQSDDTDREGHRVAGGFDYAHRFDNSVVLQAGLTATEQDAREQDQEYSAYDGYVSVFVPTWENGNAYARASYKHTDYEGRVVLFDKGREEREQRYTFGLTHNFADGWTAGANYTYTDNHSNIEIYEYDRNEISFDLNKRF
jgi:Protein of unknown function (DUF2860)